MTCSNLLIWRGSLSLERFRSSGKRASGAEVIYKIVASSLWPTRGEPFGGAPVDLADGFIHFSTAAQVVETAARHFAGEDNLLLVAVDPAQLGAALKWEPSRGGDLFPHLYGSLPLSAALWARPLPPGDDGRHDFSSLLA
ncbi:DUF952 domain-containing protein [Methylocystis bryophila]|uniref:DUF952 domain-containing protein n=1 Tax=Methylocystis bryophila TaxID=655015 RepID=UPI000A26C964|nr:DUF952 domain-containing protein [Methylocystis bryophila]